MLEESELQKTEYLHDICHPGALPVPGWGHHRRGRHGDLPRAPLAWGDHGDAASRSCSRLVPFLHHALCREDDMCSLVPGTSLWVNPLQGGDEDFTSQQHPILMAMVRCCLAGE